jgi:hypothetical protein
MIHLGHQLLFALLTLFLLGDQECWRNKFDGYFAVQQGVMCSIDDAHSAATQLRPDVVSVRKLLTDHLPSLKKQVVKLLEEIVSFCEHEERERSLRALCNTDPSGHRSYDNRPCLYGMYSGTHERALINAGFLRIFQVGLWPSQTDEIIDLKPASNAFICMNIGALYSEWMNQPIGNIQHAEKVNRAGAPVSIGNNPAS